MVWNNILKEKMAQPRKVKILDAYYNRSNNLFNLLVRDILTSKEVTLSWNGKDLNVNKKTPINIINNFCKLIIGKEKNLIIEIEETDISAKTLNNATEEQLENFNKTFDSYPWEEVLKQANESKSH